MSVPNQITKHFIPPVPFWPEYTHNVLKSWTGSASGSFSVIARHSSLVIVLTRANFKLVLLSSWNWNCNRFSKNSVKFIGHWLYIRSTPSRCYRSHSTVDECLMQSNGLDTFIERNLCIDFEQSNIMFECWVTVARVPNHTDDIVGLPIVNGAISCMLMCTDHGPNSSTIKTMCCCQNKAIRDDGGAAKMQKFYACVESLWHLMRKLAWLCFFTTENTFFGQWQGRRDHHQ